MNKTESRVWHTPDLSIAAYLMLKGLKLKTAIRDSKEGTRFTFHIDDPDFKADEYTVEFLSSESKKFDDQVRALKTLCYTKGRN